MTQMVAAHRLDGAFGFDAIVRPDGRLALLECNPRFTSGVHLVDDALLAAALLGQPLPAASAPRTRGCMVAPAMAVCARPRSASDVAALARDFWRCDDVVWDWRDPLPALAFVGVTLELSITARREQIPMRFATSHQLAWDPTCWPLAPPGQPPSGTGGATASGDDDAAGGTRRSSTPSMSTYANSQALQVP